MMFRRWDINDYMVLAGKVSWWMWFFLLSWTLASTSRSLLLRLMGFSCPSHKNLEISITREQGPKVLYSYFSYIYYYGDTSGITHYVLYIPEPYTWWLVTCKNAISRHNTFISRQLPLLILSINWEKPLSLYLFWYVMVKCTYKGLWPLFGSIYS